MSDDSTSGTERQFGEPMCLSHGTMDPATRICRNCGSEQPTPGNPWTCPECGTSQHSDREIAKLPAAIDRAVAVSAQVAESLDTRTEESQ